MPDQFPPANIPGASLRFPADQYVTLPNVPVFREHQTRAVDGRMLQFGMTQLQAVANRCNRRIAETGDYAAIVIGHTPDPSQEGASQPELVGYAGPFRLGTIGEGERKCWAILCDFHVFKDDLAKVRKHPRRSPELCLEDSYEEMFLDPIALLGAEAPRLDLGLITGQPAETPAATEQAVHLYSFVRDGRRVEKYAMAACASPSASNTFAPQKADIATHKTPQQYAAETPRTPAMLSPEDISAVVEAFLATDAGQFLVNEMKAKQGTNAVVEPSQEPPAAPAAPGAPPAAPGELPGAPAEPPAAPAAPEAPAEPLPAPAGEPEGGEGLPPAHGEPDGDEPEMPAKPEEDEHQKYAAHCDQVPDEHMEKYLSQRWKNHPRWKKYAAEMCGSVDNVPPAKAPAGDVTHKTGDPAGSGAAPPAKDLKPTQLYSRLNGELQSIKGELAAERAARRQVERYSRLQGLSAEFIMDPNDEMGLTAEMSDAQFERHVDKTIREHYQRNPVGLPWAAPPAAASTHRDPSHPANMPEETTQKHVDKAVERYQRKRSAGEACDFGAILEEVKAGR